MKYPAIPGLGQHPKFSGPPKIVMPPGQHEAESQEYNIVIPASPATPNSSPFYDKQKEGVLVFRCLHWPARRVLTLLNMYAHVAGTPMLRLEDNSRVDALLLPCRSCRLNKSSGLTASAKPACWHWVTC